MVKKLTVKSRVPSKKTKLARPVLDYVVGYKLAIAILVVAAICAQLTYNNNRDIFNAGNFFSFFTIESNIIAVAVLFVAALRRLRRQPADRMLDILRGAAVLYMLTTGAIYSLFLANADVQTALPWVDVVLHYLFPLVILVDWIIDRPTAAVKSQVAWWWLGFPLLYFVYSLVRGAAVHWYPYPFLDVNRHGYAAVLLTGLLLALGTALLAQFVAWLSRFKPVNRENPTL